MNYQTTIFNSFTGMSPLEKSALVSFLHEHDHTGNSKASVKEAVEYALKNKPSFGGFILVARKRHQIIGAVIANRTGMEGYNPTNIFVYASFHPEFHKDEIFVQEIMQKAIQYADGDIGMHVEPGNPALKMYKKLGFQAQFLELRLDKDRTSFVA